MPDRPVASSPYANRAKRWVRPMAMPTVTARTHHSEVENVIGVGRSCAMPSRYPASTTAPACPGGPGSTRRPPLRPDGRWAAWSPLVAVGSRSGGNSGQVAAAQARAIAGFVTTMTTSPAEQGRLSGGASSCRARDRRLRPAGGWARATALPRLGAFGGTARTCAEGGVESVDLDVERPQPPRRAPASSMAEAVAASPTRRKPRPRHKPHGSWGLGRFQSTWP